MDDLINKALEASISNPSDSFEVDILVDAAGVGVTEPLSSTDRKMEWTEDVLKSTFGTLKGMPINLKLKVDEATGEVVYDNHTNTVVGRVEEAYYDSARQVGVAKGKLWKHYFPETIKSLADLYSKGKVQVSTEFQPTKMEASAEDTDRPLEGRFIGLGIVDKGADPKNFVHLLASAKKEETQMKLTQSKEKGVPLPGSYEWIGSNFVQHMTASASVDNFEDLNVVGTYPDRVVWYQGDGFYQAPYTITTNGTRTGIKFGDTIEVEQDFKPLSASAPEGSENPPIEPNEEAREPMAEISDTELAALKASAAKSDELEEKVKTLEASAKDNETKLADAEQKLKEAQDREEAEKLEKLAAARMEEVEKIQKYDDADQKKEDLETFKTLDEKAFGMLKRALTASAANRGGVAPDTTITNPESREDSDGKAAAILGSDQYRALLASVNANAKEDK